jgi:hypothetical protein
MSKSMGVVVAGMQGSSSSSRGHVISKCEADGAGGGLVSWRKRRRRRRRVREENGEAGLLLLLLLLHFVQRVNLVHWSQSLHLNTRHQQLHANHHMQPHLLCQSYNASDRLAVGL